MLRARLTHNPRAKPKVDPKTTKLLDIIESSNNAPVVTPELKRHGQKEKPKMTRRGRIMQRDKKRTYPKRQDQKSVKRFIKTRGKVDKVAKRGRPKLQVVQEISYVSSDVNMDEPFDIELLKMFSKLEIG